MPAALVSIVDVPPNDSVEKQMFYRMSGGQISGGWVDYDISDSSVCHPLLGQMGRIGRSTRQDDGKKEI